MKRAASAAVLLPAVAAISVLVNLSGTVPAHADVLTVSTDLARTGWKSDEPALSPAVVQSPGFGQRFSTTVSGAIYAQPIVYQGTVFVATENDIVYAIDGTTGAIKWQRQIGTPEPAATVASTCTDLTPTHGITSTPVLDPTSGTLYVSARNWDSTNASSGTYQLHAMNISTGAEVNGWPVTFAGTAGNDPSVTFNPVVQMQRPGLLLMGGTVYTGFGSNCDFSPYKGWVIGVSTTTRQQSLWTSETGAGIDGGGIWESGGGLVSDGPGQILLTTGNGPIPPPGSGQTSPAPGALAQGAVRLAVQSDGSMVTKDWFVPATADSTSNNDIGSGGPVALPDSFGLPGHPHLTMMGSKTGVLFLLDRDNLGGRGTTTDTALAEVSPGQVFGHVGVWPGDGGYVYVDVLSTQLQAYRIGLDGTGKPAIMLAGQTTEFYYYGSGSPMVTSNGTTSGTAVLWVIRRGTPPGPSYLEAYNPVPDASKNLQLLWQGTLASATKFSVPAADGNHIYVGIDGSLVAFGPPPPVVSGISPTTGPGMGGTSVVISGSGFTGATAVRFGSTAASSFTVNSDSQITAVSPPGSGGTVDVTVVAPGGTSATAAADQFTYLSTVPGVPTNVSATAGPNSATVSWTAPSNGNSPITQYTVTPFIGSTAQTPTAVTGSPPPATAAISQLTDGATYTFTVTATNALGSGPASNPSNLVTPSCPCSIWPNGTPANAADPDTNPVEVGLKFRVDVPGSITGIRFYKGSTNKGMHTGNLWTSTGTLLASATFSNETASGWQQVSFATSVQVMPNTTYVASYFAPAGHYSSSPGYFSAGGVDVSPLHALANSTDPNGVYSYSALSTFPTYNYNATNYWVDVVFMPSDVAGVVGSDNGLWTLPGGSPPAFTSDGGSLIAAPAVVAVPQASGPSIALYLGTTTNHDVLVRNDSHGWQPLTDSPFACTDNPGGVVIGGTLYVACEGADGALWHAEVAAPSGTNLPVISHGAWQSLGGLLTAGPSVASVGGTPTYVVVGTSQRVYSRTLSTGYVAIQNWQCLGHPALASFGTNAYFACHGMDGALWYSTNSGTGWTAAQSLGGVLVDGPGIAATLGGLVFFGEGTDGALYQRTTTTGWSSDGGVVKFGAAATALG